jgi:hypothetical protein
MPTLSMEATADLLDIPATMPMSSAGAMSDASNPAVSQTFYLNSSLILYTTLPTAPPKYKRNT